jgi:hypothetical protein
MPCVLEATILAAAPCSQRQYAVPALETFGCECLFSMELFNFSALTHGASVKACSGVTGRVTQIAQRPGALKMPGSIFSGIAKSYSGLRLSALRL